MHLTLLTLIFESLFLFASTSELFESKSSDIDSLFDGENNEITMSNQISNIIGTDKLVISTEPFYNDLLSALTNFDKARIDYFMDELHYDLISTGFWNKIITMECIASVQYLLQHRFVDDDVRKQSFCFAIVTGAENIAKLMLEEYKDIIKPESKMEQDLQVKMALNCKNFKHIRIAEILIKEYFDSNIINYLQLSERLKLFKFLFSSNSHSGFKTFRVSRERVLEDSFQIVSLLPDFYNRNFEFEIEFKGESGIDDDGLTSEWLSLLVERFFVPKFESEIQSSEIPSNTFYGAPFECVDSDNKFYRISLSFTGPPEVFKFIGALMARSLFLNVPLKVKLVPSLIKRIYDKILTFEDLKDDDSIMYNSILKGIADGFDYTENENIKDLDVFLNITAVDTMYSRCKDQVDMFIQGFHSILESEIIENFFKPLEVQEILCGAVEIDRSDFYKNIIIEGEYWKQHEGIFWAGMDLLTNEELFEFIRFVTAINGLPYGGFSSLPQKIKVFDREPEKMIRSFTCYYELMLPISIRSPNELVEVLRFAFASGSEFSEELSDSDSEDYDDANAEIVNSTRRETANSDVDDDDHNVFHDVDSITNEEIDDDNTDFRDVASSDDENNSEENDHQIIDNYGRQTMLNHSSTCLFKLN